MGSHFSPQTLAEFFRDLYLDERSGVLLLEQEQQQKRIYFDRGMILLTESSLEDEQLGSFLVREGGISAGALKEAQRSLDGANGTRELARALVHRELVAKETLLHAVRATAQRVVSSVFAWPAGTSRFDEGQQEAGILETDVLATIELILLGITSMASFDVIREAMWALDSRLRIRKATPIPLERLTLSPADGFILSRIDGNTNFKGIISILPVADEPSASRFLFGMLLMGVLEYDPPVGEARFKVSDIMRDQADRQALELMQEQAIRRSYAQVREQNPYVVLGVSPPATPAQLERAYEETKSHFSRERLLPGVRDKYRTELTVIESRLIEAFLTLTQPDRGESTRAGQVEPPKEDIEVDDMRVRMEMDKAKSKVALEQATKVADTYYAKARRCMREGDFHNAIQYGKLAVSYNQSDARYYYMLADCQVRNPEARWQRMAEENYMKATQLDPWNADYWISLGRFYKKRGLNIRARKQFEEALKLVPTNETLVKELESLR